MIRFSLEANAEVGTVCLAGDFTQWQPMAMHLNGDGRYEALVSLMAGDYGYRFAVDGRWMKDPDNSFWAISTDGALRSVARIE